MLIALVVILAIGAALLAIAPRFNPELYKHRLFSPEPFNEAEYIRDAIRGVEPEDVFLDTKSGPRIHGWYYKLEGSDQIVLISHGNAGHLGAWRETADHALRNGMSALVYDYRGYGLSIGVPTLWGITEDGLTVFDWLCHEENFKPENIVLYGISMGTGVSCQIAKQRPHAGLILESGFSTFRRLTNEIEPITRHVPMFFYFRQQFNNVAVVRELGTPKLIFHGALDDLIVVDHAHELFEEAQEPKELMIFPLMEHRGFGSASEESQHGAAIDHFLQSRKPAVVTAGD